MSDTARQPIADTPAADPAVAAPPSADAWPIGARIAYARERNRFSRRELAAAVGMHHTTLDKWERGEAMPAAGPLFKLAAALNVDINWLLDPNSPLDASAAAMANARPQAADFQSALAYRRAVNIVFDAVIEADHGLELVDLINAVDRVSDMLDDAHEMHSRQPSQPAGIAAIRPPSDDDTDTLAEHIIAELEKVLLHLQEEHGWTPGKISEAAADLVNSTSCLDEQYAGRIADAMQSLAANK